MKNERPKPKVATPTKLKIEPKLVPSKRSAPKPLERHPEKSVDKAVERSGSKSKKKVEKIETKKLSHSKD